MPVKGPISKTVAPKAIEHQIGERDSESGLIILSSSDPYRTADVFLQNGYSAEGVLTLRSYAGVFFVWRENCFTQIEEQEVRKAVYEFTKDALDLRQDRRGQLFLVPFQPTATRVNNIIDGIRSYAFIPQRIAPPCWLDDNKLRPNPAEMLVCRSGSLHIPTLRHLAPTPALFSTFSINIDWCRNAAPPKRWLNFLGQLWPNDAESIRTLQDWFGYILTSDNSLHKMLLLVGLPRSGKGTIARVLTALIGASNVTGSTTSGLTRPFGLQALIGKSLAIISDARLGVRSENSTLVERLLAISGVDLVTIERKHLPSVDLRLSTRFMFLSNEVPKFQDASGALASRFVVLNLRASFLGRENPNLTNELLAELPGILLWAIDGWNRIQATRQFSQPSSAIDTISRLTEATSPLAAFVQERCSFDPAASVSVAEIFRAFKNWSKGRGHDGLKTTTVFGRELLHAFPTIRQYRPRSGAARQRGYVGIRLLKSGPQRSAVVRTFLKSKGNSVRRRVVQGKRKSVSRVHTGPSRTKPKSPKKCRSERKHRQE